MFDLVYRVECPLLSYQQARMDRGSHSQKELALGSLERSLGSIAKREKAVFGFHFRCRRRERERERGGWEVKEKKIEGSQGGGSGSITNMAHSP